MKNNKLNILWTNDDITTSKFMVMMYTGNSIKLGWWNEVTVIIWGAATNLVAENTEIQELINAAKKTGVMFSACKACATELGVKDALLDLGIELKYWGDPLTEIIKNNENLITI